MFVGYAGLLWPTLDADGHVRRKAADLSGKYVWLLPDRGAGRAPSRLSENLEGGTTAGHADYCWRTLAGGFRQTDELEPPRGPSGDDDGEDDRYCDANPGVPFRFIAANYRPRRRKSHGEISAGARSLRRRRPRPLDDWIGDQAMTRVGDDGRAQRHERDGQRVALTGRSQSPERSRPTSCRGLERAVVRPREPRT